ncbi:phage shock protein A (PspA) family protein [Lentibacillus persicus]|uniref:Phage shock protein A (PspA) family protein n=1 Tax=Lentibacillus persicus TaxID=640948 RepID=A0A1I1TQ93_9BACI|nr:PspA/IM30 family protein [Lentibacillus persicus]SFD60916.1 phage shock protein A (PspA) family protein [Lentibacillus persicus]
MFKFFKRVSTVVGSELNAMIDKAEDPVKMLDQYMRDMESDIREADSAVAKQVANEKMLKRKTDDAQAKVEKRQNQAEQAIEADDEDLAKRALEDKADLEHQAELLKESWEQANQDTSELQHKLDEMKKEYQQMKLKKDALQARAETAKTKTKMNRTMSAIGSDDSRKGFERMEEKVLQYEAEADTSEDYSHESRSLDKAFERLNTNNSKVNDELAELKKKMGKD